MLRFLYLLYCVLFSAILRWKITGSEHGDDGRATVTDTLRIEVLHMSKLVLNTNTLPEPLIRLISTAKVMVNQENGVINLIAILDDESDCPLLGIAADCGFTVDEFLARKREEKVLEGG